MESIYNEYGHGNGLAAAVFDTEGTVYHGFFGALDKETGLAPDENTVLDWGSITKLLVWVSAMQLWEQGLLDLDADIRDILPKGFLKRLKYDNHITMIDLMNHAAGFEDSYFNFYVIEKETFANVYLNVTEDRVECEEADLFYHPQLNRFGKIGYYIWMLISMFQSVPGYFAVRTKWTP